jgi:hypothetical protein
VGFDESSLCPPISAPSVLPMGSWRKTGRVVEKGADALKPDQHHTGWEQALWRKSAPSLHVLCKGGDGYVSRMAVLTIPMAQHRSSTQEKRKRSTEGYAPRYTVIEQPDGFRVEGRDRDPVSVRLSPAKTFLLVEIPRYEQSGPDGETTGTAKCNLFGYARLLSLIAQGTMQHWRRPPEHEGTWSGAYEWALSHTRRALHVRGVYHQWQRLLTLIPSPQREVIKAVFAATFDSYRLGGETWPEIYAHAYLIEDILRYRAAACAVHDAERLAHLVGCLTREQRETASFTGRKAPLAPRFEALLSSEAPWPYFWPDSPEQLEERSKQEQERRQELVALLAQDWKAFYSASGKASTSLRRTLMNLPGGVSGKLLCELPKLEAVLSRPVTDRVELMTLLLWARQASAWAEQLIDPMLWEGPIYMKARRGDILSALHLLSTQQQRAIPGEPALKPYRQGLAFLVDYLNDYCRACRQEGVPAHRGTLVGLVEKAIRWHREIVAREQQRYQALLDGTALSALPPVPLPDDPAITFLRSVGDILQEGAAMHHCIASYAALAMRGHCYLFHVRYQGYEASVQVGPTGSVVQAYGPYNRLNRAAEYGRHMLSGWGKTFATDTKHREAKNDTWLEENDAVPL